MVEILTILGIALALEYLLGLALDRKPVDQWSELRRDWEEMYVGTANAGQSVILEESRSPIIGIREILPRYSGQRDFRVIAEREARPVEMESYMPFAYGDSLPDDPSRIATNVSYDREHQTKTHAVWHVSYKFSPSRFASDDHEGGLSATEYAARLFSIGCLTANEVRQVHG